MNRGAAAPAFDVRPIRLADARPLFERFHAYKGAGNTATYALGCIESGRIVAAFMWQPPAPGAALSVCAEAPHGVLALSRMVAVPRDERVLRHISKPLRHIMRRVIDRGRWPVLVTYSDEGAGHTGHVYKCSGWTATHRAKVPFYVDGGGRSREFLQRWRASHGRNHARRNHHDSAVGALGVRARRRGATHRRRWLGAPVDGQVVAQWCARGAVGER